MSQDNIAGSSRVWYESSHACLCLLGMHLRRTGFFGPLEQELQIKQKCAWIPRSVGPLAYRVVPSNP